MRLLFITLLFPLLAVSQVASFGVKGGATLGDPAPIYTTLIVNPGHWTVGPTAEFFLPAHFSIEIDALYSGYRMRGIQTVPSVLDGISSGPGFKTDTRWNTKAWDFPILLKYRFSKRKVTPYIFGGFDYRHESSDITTACSALDGGPCPALFTSSYGTSQDRTGPAMGTGLEFRYGALRISPEFRYVRLDRPGANQYGLLLGISF